MKIINPSYDIVSPKDSVEGIEMLRRIEYFGRISHRSEEKQTSDSWKKFIQAVVIDHGDLSIIEHCSASVVFRIDRAICMEMVRHRLFSYTMESTRFVRYKGNMEFILPERMKEDLQSIGRFETAMTDAENDYHFLLDRGGRPQEARSVLPNALAATIAVTGNLRNFRHLFLMRTSLETHSDFKAVTVPLLSEFKARVPILFDDIEPNARQIENLRKPR